MPQNEPKSFRINELRGMPDAQQPETTADTSQRSMTKESQVLTEEEQKEILESIANSGSAEKSIRLSGNLNHVLNMSSGSPRIQTNVINRFKLILSQPLAGFNSFEIRCCVCKRVISYPTWYYSVKYSVNHFHYFICFDSSSPNKPSTKCYRKSI